MNNLNGTSAGSTLAGILLALTAGLMACRHEEPARQSPALTVRTATVRTTPVPQEYSYPGTIEGEKKITLSTKVMGQIVSFPVEEGSAVKQGQLLAKIRSGDLEAKHSQVQASREEASAALKNIETNYNRIRELYERKSATQKELDDVTMAYDMAKAKMKAVDEMDKEVLDALGYATIVSPIPGSVVGKFLEEGDMANPGMPIVAVEDARTLEVSALVPESEVGLFTRGQRVVVRVDALGGQRSIAGTVAEVNPSGNPATRQFHIKVKLAPQANSAVKSGMYATVILAAPGTREAIAVPESLLVRRGSLDGLFTVAENHDALLRWVRTGQRLSGGRIEILSGLSDGDVIVAERDERLKDGEKVGVAQ